MKGGPGRIKDAWIAFQHGCLHPCPISAQCVTITACEFRKTHRITPFIEKNACRACGREAGAGILTRNREKGTAFAVRSKGKSPAWHFDEPAM